MKCGTWSIGRKLQMSGLALLLLIVAYSHPDILDAIKSAHNGTNRDGRLQRRLDTLQSKAYQNLNSTNSPVRVGKSYRETNVEDQNTSLSEWLKEQTEMALHVDSMCKNLHTKYLKQNSRQNHILVNDRHKVLYCSVPKVGCTTWQTMFSSLAEGYEYLRIPERNIHRYGEKGYHKLRTGEMAEVASYRKFMFVRDPFERLVSLYREKVETNGDRHFFGNLQRKPSFLEFIAYLVRTHSRDGHFMSHLGICHPCDIHYDAIGKYETFRRDSLYILEFLFNKTSSEAAAYMATLNQSKGPPTRDLTEEYWSKIPSSLIAEIVSMYKGDFVMFHYNSSRWETNA